MHDAAMLFECARLEPNDVSAMICLSSASCWTRYRECRVNDRSLVEIFRFTILIRARSPCERTASAGGFAVLARPPARPFPFATQHLSGAFAFSFPALTALHVTKRPHVSGNNNSLVCRECFHALPGLDAKSIHLRGGVCHHSPLPRQQLPQIGFARCDSDHTSSIVTREYFGESALRARSDIPTRLQFNATAISNLLITHIKGTLLGFLLDERRLRLRTLGERSAACAS